MLVRSSKRYFYNTFYWCTCKVLLCCWLCKGSFVLWSILYFSFLVPFFFLWLGRFLVKIKFKTCKCLLWYCWLTQTVFLIWSSIQRWDMTLRRLDLWYSLISICCVNVLKSLKCFKAILKKQYFSICLEVKIWTFVSTVGEAVYNSCICEMYTCNRSVFECFYFNVDFCWDEGYMRFNRISPVKSWCY